MGRRHKEVWKRSMGVGCRVGRAKVLIQAEKMAD